MTNVDLIYFNAGGGHRAAARALEAVIQTHYPEWNVRCVNLVDVLDPDAQFERLAGIPPEDVYNKRLARGWTAGMAQELRVLQAVIRLGHRLLVRRLRRHWARTQPDLVVSLIPNFNLAMHDGLRAARPDVPFVTVLTDMADHPPSFWIEPGTAQHVVCGTAYAEAQALALGCPERQVHRTSGMILRPEFYEPLAVDVASERMAVGLRADRAVGVVMFGGHGSISMLSIAKQLEDVQLILLCGHNKGLARKLRLLPSSAAHHVVEFTPEVPRYMQLGDFFIGKPGPGSLSEAVQQGLPVITTRNVWTLPQERYNTEWVREHGLGIVVGSTRKIGSAAIEVLRRLDEFKANVRAMENGAVFEVPDILARILVAGPAPVNYGASHGRETRLRRVLRAGTVRRLILRER